MANPPPFFKLNMSNGSGKGSVSADVTPMDILQEGYDQGYVDGEAGGAGAPGALSYDSGPTGLTFGTVAPGELKEIDFSGTGGETYITRLVFSGDLAAFGIDRVTKNGTTYARASTFQCSSGEDFVLGFDEPSGGSATGAIRFVSQYTDGTAKTMTVEIYDAGSGALIDTISATATVLDAFLGASIALSGSLGVWSPASVADGVKGNGDTLMEDQRAVPAPDLIFRKPGTGAFSVLAEGSGPSSAVPSLKKSVLTTEHYESRGYGIVASALAAGIKSGVVVYKSSDTTGDDTYEIVAADGVDGTPEPGSSAPGYLRDGTAVGWRWTVAGIPTAMNVNLGAPGTGWNIVAWSYDPTDSDNVSVYESTFTGTWKDLGTNVTSHAHTPYAGWRTGFKAHFSGSFDPYEVAGATFWSDPHSEAELQSVYDAIAGT